MNILILDTNIYRQLGVPFYKHVDYLGLEDYCYSSGSEIIVTKTVREEYLDFYSNNISKHVELIKKSYEQLSKFRSFSKIKSPNFSNLKRKENLLVLEKIEKNTFAPRLDSFITEENLLGFLIENKRASKNDNTRDFLIWLNALAASERFKNDQVIIISEDKIFEENSYFKALREKLNVNPIKVFKSISSFLSVHGFSSQKLTKEFVLSHISEAKIRKELLRDKDSIPSHISELYYSQKKKYKLEEFDIEEIRVKEFYSHKELETSFVKIIAQIEVQVKMVYEAEKNTQLVIDHLNACKIRPTFHPETFDEEFRPVFNDWILFHFQLVYSEDENKILSSKFLDFFPDYSRFDMNDQEL
jgi:hypothetical protein